MEKSDVFLGKTVTSIRANDIVQKLSMRRGQLPFRYLGVPLFRGTPKCKHLQEIAIKTIANFLMGKVLIFRWLEDLLLLIR